MDIKERVYWHKYKMENFQRPQIYNSYNPLILIYYWTLLPSIEFSSYYSST